MVNIPKDRGTNRVMVMWVISCTANHSHDRDTRGMGFASLSTMPTDGHGWITTQNPSKHMSDRVAEVGPAIVTQNASYSQNLFLPG